MITWREYRAGDIAVISHSEPEPFDGWTAWIEGSGQGMATVELCGVPIAAFGCVPCWDGVADCFTVLDRAKAIGHGRMIARMIRARINQAMPVLGLHRMQANAGATDRQAQVFLRAIGFRREGVMRMGSPDRSDLITYALLESGK